MVIPSKKFKPTPFMFPMLCKACGRCIESCPQHCIEEGTEVDPVTGLTPVVVDLEHCNYCGLCLEACPEPKGLMPLPRGLDTNDMVLSDPFTFFDEERDRRPTPETVPDERVPLPALEPMVLKGTHASAIGAVLGGCRHFFGYPITPSTEGAELMANLLPDLGGFFVQAVSEVATANMLYGCAGAGQRSMTFTSSPGFSLMLEGISYMIGAELPAVFVNVMRGGPGLGNVGPEQGDIKLVCRGLGHGNTHALVLAPASPQEMLDLTMEAFDLAFRYRNPVIVVGDGYLGQIAGRVTLPDHLVKPGLPSWAVYGDAAHRGNLHTSILLNEPDLEAHNRHLNDKYRRISEEQQRWDAHQTEDAEWLIVACNTPARMAQGAVKELRERGIKVGLFRPVSLWPFPVDGLTEALARKPRVVVVEAGSGQLEDELRMALSRRGLAPPRIDHVQRLGGVLPQQREIVDRVAALAEEVVS